MSFSIYCIYLSNFYFALKDAESKGAGLFSTTKFGALQENNLSEKSEIEEKKG